MEICRVCKMEVESDGGENPRCSEFCGAVSSEKKIQFLTAKEGEVVLLPCAGCGKAHFMPYSPGAMCRNCGEQHLARRTGEVLSETVTSLREVVAQSSACRVLTSDFVMKLGSLIHEIELLRADPHAVNPT